MENETPLDKRKEMKNIISLLMEHKFRFAFALICVIISTVLTVIAPVLIGDAVGLCLIAQYPFNRIRSLCSQFHILLPAELFHHSNLLKHRIYIKGEGGKQNPQPANE